MDENQNVEETVEKKNVFTKVKEFVGSKAKQAWDHKGEILAFAATAVGAFKLGQFVSNGGGISDLADLAEAEADVPTEEDFATDESEA